MLSDVFSQCEQDASDPLSSTSPSIYSPNSGESGYPSTENDQEPQGITFVNQKSALYHKEQFFNARTPKERCEAIENAYYSDHLLFPFDNKGNTLFHLLCEQADLFSILHALNREPTTASNVTNYHGQTPLFFARKANRNLVSRILLEYGAIPLLDKENHFQDSPFFHLALKPLQTYANIQHYLSQLALEGSEDIIISLLESGFALNEPVDADDNTLLHFLAKYVPLPVIATLLHFFGKEGLNKKNSYGQTPLMIAAYMGRQRLVNFLLASGAQVESKDKNGCTVIDYGTPRGISFSVLSPTEPLPFSIYEYFMHHFKSQTPTPTDPLRLSFRLFDAFIVFIKKHQWKYKRSVERNSEHDRLSESAYILDCSYDKSYTVNCYDLANGFCFLARALGISAIPATYVNYHSALRLPQSRIQGEFTCFDPDAQQDFIQAGSYNFAYHQVSFCGNKVFDPTLCCHYDQLEDILLINQSLPDRNTSPQFNLYKSRATEHQGLRLVSQPLLHHESSQQTYQRLTRSI